MNWEDLGWVRRASRRARYLVGVSGGADSVALLCGLHGLGFRQLVVCHLHHGLRGEEADADAAWVRDLATRLGLPFEIEREDIAVDAEREACSIETAGRHARHRFFARCGRKWRCRRLLLAHHADDQVETVLWNLLRGSRGVVGMREEQVLTMAGREMRVMRPLLEVRRDELRAWLAAEGQAWREDASNAEPFTARNRLRLEVLPLLADVARRDVVPPLLRAAESTAEMGEIEAWAMDQARVLDPQGRLHVSRLRELPTALQRACLHGFLRDEGIPDLDRAVLTRVFDMLDPGGAAKLVLPGGRRLRRRQGRMWVEPPERD